MSKKKSGRKQSTKSFGDVTIHDFANATTPSNRLKKSSNNVSTLMKRLNTDEKPWYEKEEFEGDFDLVQEENEDGTTTVLVKKSAVQRQRAIKSECSEGGNEYPLDVWFLISEYIRPENVSTFAGICRSSLAITCTAKFWFGLYRRYYQSVPKLPERLQPECMQRFYGLRTSVIRALYHMYPLFITRFQGSDSLWLHQFEKDRDLLLRRQCHLMWYRRTKAQWTYYFKLKQPQALPHRFSRREISHRPDLIEMLEDISANADEDCRLLQVTCVHFAALPIVLGLTLSSVSLTLSEGFTHHRLQLVFGSHGSPSGSDSVTVVLDPVVKIKVLDWWHPLYPHDQSMLRLLNQD